KFFKLIPADRPRLMLQIIRDRSIAMAGWLRKSAVPLSTGLPLLSKPRIDAKAIKSTGDNEQQTAFTIPGRAPSCGAGTAITEPSLSCLFLKAEAKMGPAITMAGMATITP